MQERQYSGHKQTSRFSGIHVLATSFAAVAGVAIAAYQAINHKSEAPPPTPVQVTVAVDPAKVAAAGTTAGADVNKGDPAGSVAIDGTNIAQGAGLSAALNDGSEQRYKFADMFDGNPQTAFSIHDPDSEVNVLMSFAGGAQPVRQIEYMPPASNDGTAATQLDVMVLPEGQMNGTGSAIQSFTLQTTPGKQLLDLPGSVAGKALWLRIAGPGGQKVSPVGEFRILK